MSIWVVAGVILTGAWTQLDELRWAGWLPLVVTLVLDRLPSIEFTAWPSRRDKVAAIPVVAAALLCALVLAHVALTAGEEFGFGGDEGYHLSATRAFALYYVRAAPMLAAVVAIYALWRWRGWPFAGSIAMLALIASSFFLPPSPLFGRYPAAFYLLALPLNVAFELAGASSPAAANHIVNGLSLPVWLFVLRPLVIGKWPDWQVLPAALLLYFQAPSLTFIASALLEPWSFVFLLLAIEAVVVFPPDQRWFAVMIAAMATWFKETSMLLLPAIWILACVEWTRGLPALRRNAIAAGVAACTPFLVYYFVRLDSGIQRTVTMAADSGVWTASRAAEWLTNTTALIGVSAFVGVVLVFAATARHFIWTLTTVATAIFFFVETLSIPYTGYARFLAVSAVALCGALIATTHRIADRRVLIAWSAILALLQVVPFSRTLALDFGPDYERNSLEWRGSLVRLPLRALANRIDEARDAPQVRSLRVISFGVELISMPVAYPDLARRYTLTLDQQGAGAPDCRCRDQAEAILAGFEWPAHFGDTAANRASFANASAVCVEQVRTTCATTILEHHASGAVIGALGVGRIGLVALPEHDQRAQR